MPAIVARNLFSFDTQTKNHKETSQRWDCGTFRNSLFTPMKRTSCWHSTTINHVYTHQETLRHRCEEGASEGLTIVLPIPSLACLFSFSVLEDFVKDNGSCTALFLLLVFFNTFKEHLCVTAVNHMPPFCMCDIQVR